MAAWTSRAAPSMLRLKSNFMVMLVVPRLLDEVISVMPAILPNWRSRGVATEEAMISGLAPGKPAPTEIVGKSTWGSGDTGNTRKATAPERAMAAVRSVVATGRRINGDERLIALIRRHHFGSGIVRTARREAMREPVEEDINDRSRVERQNLAQEQTANHGDAQGATQLRAYSGTEGQRQAGQQGSHGGHHDGTEAQEARFIDGDFRLFALFALRFQSEVNHHNSVFLDDADQENDPYKGDNAEFLAEKQQGQNGAHPGGGQRGQNGEGMDVTFVENAKDDINRDQRRENQ